MRNLQGDVIALADMEERGMIEYNYDPWDKISYTYFDENGNPSNEIADESLQMITAIFCPLTYRGYNYDFTTGLYYLQSRYYNPEWGRFLNCDDTSILLATQGETHGANLYAYCGNDPVNMVDYTGYWGKEVHYDDTRLWAMDFFYAFDAITIAEANHSIDSIIDGKHAVFPSQQRYHFNRNPSVLIDSRKSFAIASLLIAAMFWIDAEITFEKSNKNQWSYLERDLGYYTALTYLGKGLHSLQDYQGHGNIGADDFYAQHVISFKGGKVYQADNTNYSWVAGSNMTKLYKDSNRRRYHATLTDTYNYFNAFTILITYMRSERGLPNRPLNRYELRRTKL